MRGERLDIGQHRGVQGFVGDTAYAELGSHGRRLDGQPDRSVVLRGVEHKFGSLYEPGSSDYEWCDRFGIGTRCGGLQRSSTGRWVCL